MWKYRCDNLKRDMMEQVKGMGDKMDWDSVLSREMSVTERVDV